jgi:hypothetical protein
MQQYSVQSQPQVHSQAQYSPRQLLESARRAEADGNVDLASHVSRYVLEHFPGSPESAEAYNCLMRLGQPPLEQSAAPVLVGMQPQPSPQQMMPAYAAPAPHASGQGVRFNGAPHGGTPGPAWAPAPQVAAVSNGQAGFAGPAPARAPAPGPQAVVNGSPYAAQMQTPVQAIAANFAPSAPYRGAAQASASPPAMIHHAPEVTPQYRGGRIVARFAFAAGGLMILAGLLTPVPAFLGMLGPQPSLLGTSLVACALIASGLLALLGGQTALAVFDQADNMRELVELERTRWNG